MDGCNVLEMGEEVQISTLIFPFLSVRISRDHHWLDVCHVFDELLLRCLSRLGDGSKFLPELGKILEVLVLVLVLEGLVLVHVLEDFGPSKMIPIS